MRDAGGKEKGSGHYRVEIIRRPGETKKLGWRIVSNRDPSVARLFMVTCRG